MQAHNLTKAQWQKDKRRIARGGKRGSFSGKGVKGQKSRAGRRIRPQIRDVVKKIHKRRGYGKNRGKSFCYIASKPHAVSLRRIESMFDDGAHITLALLAARGLIKRNERLVKILGNAKPQKHLTFDTRILMSGQLHAMLNKDHVA